MTLFKTNMSNPQHTRAYGVHGDNHFELMSKAATPAMAYAPKGTLALRPMTSRENGYNPDAVVIEGFGYEPFGSDFLHDKKPTLVASFFAPENRRLITDAVVDTIAKEEEGSAASSDRPSHLTSAQIPVTMVNESMNRALEIYGDSVENAPRATVGPSESLPWLAPESKYDRISRAGNLAMDLAQLNLAAARLLRDQVVSEKLHLRRYMHDLSGAVHVLEYPMRPGADMRRGHQLDNPYVDDISSAPYTGISGNRVFPNTAFDSVQFNQPNVQQWPGVPNQFERRL